jgi:hypothetical protein
MGNGEIITCDITLRYVRAYIKKPGQQNQNKQQNNASLLNSSNF